MITYDAEMVRAFCVTGDCDHLALRAPLRRGEYNPPTIELNTTGKLPSATTERGKPMNPNDNILYRYIRRTNVHLAVFCIVLAIVIGALWFVIMPHLRTAVDNLPPAIPVRYGMVVDSRFIYTLTYWANLIATPLFIILAIGWLVNFVRLIIRIFSFNSHPTFKRIEKIGGLDSLLSELSIKYDEDGRTVKTLNWVFERKLFCVYISKRTKLGDTFLSNFRG